MKSYHLFVGILFVAIIALAVIGGCDTRDMKYGAKTYAVWLKLHPSVKLTHDEWVIAVKMGMLDKYHNCANREEGK